MIEAGYQQDFSGGRGGRDASTVYVHDLGENTSGWTIEGEVQEDYYEWVNDFQAVHPELGLVWGNYEEVVYATSQEAFDHFVEHHPSNDWDYWDI